MRWIFGLVAACGMASAVAAAQDNSVRPDAVVQSHITAYVEADFEAFMGTFSPNAVVVFDGQRYSGQSQIRQIYYANFLEGAPQIYIADSKISGNEVILQEGYVFPDGTDICCSRSTYTVKGGKISKIVIVSPQ